MNKAIRIVFLVSFFVFTLFSANPLLENAGAEEFLIPRKVPSDGGGTGCTPDPSTRMYGVVKVYNPDTNGVLQPISGATITVITHDTRWLRICSSYGTTRELLTTPDGIRYVKYTTTTAANGSFNVYHLPQGALLGSIDVTHPDYGDLVNGRETAKLPNSSTYNAGNYALQSGQSINRGGATEPMAAAASISTLRGTVRERLLDNSVYPSQNFTVLIESADLAQPPPGGPNCLDDSPEQEEYSRTYTNTYGVWQQNVSQDKIYFITVFGRSGFETLCDLAAVGPPHRVDTTGQWGISGLDFTVDELDNPPTIQISQTSPISPDLNEGQAFSFTVIADDPDPNHTVTVVTTGRPGWLEESVTAGAQGTQHVELLYKARDTVAGTDTIPFSAVNHLYDYDTDGDLNIDYDLALNIQLQNNIVGPSNYPITGLVEDVDRPIAISRADLSVPEGSTTDFDATATDPDWAGGNEDRIELFNIDAAYVPSLPALPKPAWLIVQSSTVPGNPVTLTLRANPPAEAAAGPYRIRLVADNNFVANPPPVERLFDITVANVEYAPEITGTTPPDPDGDFVNTPEQNFTMNEGTTQGFTVSARDLDSGDTLNYVWELRDEGGVLIGSRNTPGGTNPGSDTYTFSPALGQGGLYNLSVRINDNDATPIGPLYTFRVTVRSGPITSTSQNPNPVPEGVIVNFDVTITDADTPGDNLVITPTFWPDFMKNVGKISGPAPNPGDPVVYRFRGAPPFDRFGVAQNIQIQASDGTAFVTDTFPVAISQGTALYVDGPYRNPEGFPAPFLGQGTQSYPYPTVQGGIVMGNTSDPGNFINTVMVRPGMYEETVLLDGRNLTIRSEMGPEVTRLSAPFDDLLSPYVFLANNVTTGGLIGFDIDGRSFSTYGVHVSNTGTNFVVRNNIIRRCGSEGIRLDGTASGGDARILNNVITGNDGYGMIVKFSVSTPHIVNNIFIDNEEGPLNLSSGAAPTLIDSNVIDTGTLPGGTNTTVAGAADLFIGDGDYHLKPTATAALNNGNTTFAAGARDMVTDVTNRPIDRGHYGGGKDASGNPVNGGLPWTDPANKVARADEDTAALATESNIRILNGSRSSYPNAYNAYTWKRGATPIGSGPRPLYTPPAAGLDTLTLEVSDGVTTVTDSVGVNVRTAARELWVDAARPDDSGDGLSEATAKRHVQAAMDIAMRTDIIRVKPGFYNATGDDVRMKDGVTLRAETSGLEDLALQATLAGPKLIPLIAEDLSSGEVDGMSFWGNTTDYYGIYSTNSNLLIRHANIAGYLERGIAIDYGNVTVSNNQIIMNAQAINNGAQIGPWNIGLSANRARLTVHNNTFDYNNNVGMFFMYLASGSDIQNNIVTRSFVGIDCWPDIAGGLQNGNAVTLNYNAAPSSGPLANGIGSFCSDGPQDFGKVAGDTQPNPYFVNPLTYPEDLNYDYRLQTALSQMDNRGNPAIAFNDRDGSRNDMGVYGGPDRIGVAGDPPAAPESATAGGADGGIVSQPPEPEPDPISTESGDSLQMMME